MIDFDLYTNEALDLLKRLIATPSVSRQEDDCAEIMMQTLKTYGLKPHVSGCNTFVVSEPFDNSKQTILLNAHIDTVKPVVSWQRNPFVPELEGDRLYGLGSNDCGGGLVSLLQAFRILTSGKANKKYNFVYLASCEEEVSGSHGIEQVLPLLPKIDVAIVGEPTGMQPAIAEKGLMVLDITARGKSGHAARNEGLNAIYEMLDDLVWIRNYRFEKTSSLLGPTLMQVTQVEAGTQHNVVPDVCRAVVDIRTNELYTNEEVFDFVKKHCRSDVKARSFRLHSSHIDPEHPLVAKCKAMGMKPYGSPTLSDQALMPFPSFKLGPGESSRSHSADEFICVSEITDAIRKYVNLLG
jgi:acetylornithine deacetylase